MLNTVVLGEGVSKSKYTPYFGHHSCFLTSCITQLRSITHAASSLLLLLLLIVLNKLHHPASLMPRVITA